MISAQKLWTGKALRLAVAVSLLLGVTLTQVASGADKPPKINFGYIFTTHHTPFIVAMAEGEKLKDQGVYLKSLVPKQKYQLMIQGKPIAELDIVVAKSGSETATLFAQKRLDVALASITAMMSGIDKGMPIKVLCPTHVDGMGLVFPKDTKLKGWEDFLAYVKASKKPVKIGYHSPTSAPRIALEGALHRAGLKVTGDANDLKAQVLLVDLKTTANLIPALVSGQVDACVGPAPFPEVAEAKGVGKVVLDLRDLPPPGFWHNFPCCVMAATQETISKHPEVLKNLTQLLTANSEWSNQNKDKIADITAAWIGVPAAAVKKSTIIYTSQPSENWLRGVGLYLDMLNKMNKFKGKLKGKKLAEVEPIIFDFSFVEKPAAKK
jgi:NitT/TauT family transport system substrate-binding protein